MPQNIVDADLWTVTVQAAADGDAVDGASQLLIGQDLSDRTRWLYNRLIGRTTVPSGVGTPGAPFSEETVAAGAVSATVLAAIPPAELATGDWIMVEAMVRAQPNGGAAGPYTWALWLYDNTSAAIMGDNSAHSFDYYTHAINQSFTIYLKIYQNVTAGEAAAGFSVRLWNGSAQSIDLYRPWYVAYQVMRSL